MVCFGPAIVQKSIKSSSTVCMTPYFPQVYQFSLFRLLRIFSSIIGIIEKPAWRPACIHAAGGNASCPHGRVRDDQLHADASWLGATGTLHSSDPLRDAVLKQNGETAPVRLPCGSSGELAPSIFPSPLTTERRQIREASVSSLGQAFDPSRSFSCLQAAPFPKKPDLGQASLGVALAGFPLPGRWNRGQARYSGEPFSRSPSPKPCVRLSPHTAFQFPALPGFGY